MKICPAPAILSSAQLAEVQAFEKKAGIILVAYEKIPKLAHLTSQELTNLRNVEQQTGKILLAYEG